MKRSISASTSRCKNTSPDPMSARFHPRLVNDPFDDPALYIPFAFEKRALLFDLGDLSRLPPKDILKISHCFVSHTHMDHFCGFDRLLRICLGRPRQLHLYGPEGFLHNLEGKLRLRNLPCGSKPESLTMGLPAWDSASQSQCVSTLTRLHWDDWDCPPAPGLNR